MFINRLLDMMKQEPLVFVNEEKLSYIYQFIAGFCYGGAKNNLPDNDMDCEFGCWFWKWLLQWIEENVDAKYTPESCHWDDDIKAIAGGEENEVSMFYKLCELFFEDYENKRGYFEWRK